MNKRGIVYTLVLIVVMIAVQSCGGSKKANPVNISSRAGSFAPHAFEYCKKNGFNTRFFFFIDMSVHSGFKRFAIWDFKEKKVLDSGLVSHGCGKNPWGEDKSKDNPSFSNDTGSHCSSLGMYKVGEKGVSKWGIKIMYNLYGLELSNNNAIKREIILHSWDQIADEVVFPDGTPEGWGCPAVSNQFMKGLDSLLKKSTKPVLLWIVK